MSENHKQNCGIARDLMPLAIDGVCGESSKAFLHDHLAACDECRQAYEKMQKPADAESAQVPPTEESQALAKSVKKTARRMKRRRLLIILLIPVLLWSALFTASRINQYRMSVKKPLPMNTYDISLQKSGRYVALDLNIYNAPGSYQSTNFTYNIITQETPDGLNRASVITLTPTYCPNQEWHYNQGHIATFSLNGRYTDQLCMVDGILYTINDVVYEYEDPSDENSYTLHVTLGMPVMEICVTDGQGVKTLYTWGDEIPELAQDSAHHFGHWNNGKGAIRFDTDSQNAITVINEAVLWNTEVLITPEEMALFPPTDSAEIARANVMSHHEVALISSVDSTPMPYATLTPMHTKTVQDEDAVILSEPTQTPPPDTDT